MRVCHLLFILVLLSLTLVGCGGGGGKSAGGRILYVTDWSGTGTAGGLDGVSQRVTLMRLDGTVAAQKILEKSGATKQQIPFTDLATGEYVLRSELNDAAAFGGTVVGTLEAIVSVGSTFESNVGLAPTTLKLPSSIQLDKGTTRRLSAQGASSNGRVTFLPPNVLNWTIQGAGATLEPGPMLRGSAVGNGTLTVRRSDTNQTFDIPVEVRFPGARKGKWTVMVYLNAANDLYPFSTPNVDQMERIANNPDVRFVVQWKQTQKVWSGSTFDGTRRYLVKPDTRSGINSELVETVPNVDMGKPESVGEFVTWAKERYPADRYVLVIWNHGNGWKKQLEEVQTRSISYDDEFRSAIRTWQLPQAIAGHKVDILSFDACLMQMVEIASELKPFADYIAASAENTPAPGYPYDRVFRPFVDSPDLPTRTLSKGFVDGHVGHLPYQTQFVTQSVLDTAKIAPLEQSLDVLAGALIANVGEIGNEIKAVRAQSPKYAYAGDGRNYYDLGDLLQRMQGGAFPSSVTSAAATAHQRLREAVVWEGHTEKNSFSQGLAIDFSPSTAAQPWIYDRLNFAKTTRWGEWLKIAP